MIQQGWMASDPLESPCLFPRHQVYIRVLQYPSFDRSVGDLNPGPQA